ncbi:B2 protein, partial [Sesamum alatum]
MFKLHGPWLRETRAVGQGTGQGYRPGGWGGGPTTGQPVSMTRDRGWRRGAVIFDCRRGAVRGGSRDEGEGGRLVGECSEMESRRQGKSPVAEGGGASSWGREIRIEGYERKVGGVGLGVGPSLGLRSGRPGSGLKGAAVEKLKGVGSPLRVSSSPSELNVPRQAWAATNLAQVTEACEDLLCNSGNIGPDQGKNNSYNSLGKSQLLSLPKSGADISKFIQVGTISSYESNSSHSLNELRGGHRKQKTGSALQEHEESMAESASQEIVVGPGNIMVSTAEIVESDRLVELPSFQVPGRGVIQVGLGSVGEEALMGRRKTGTVTLKEKSRISWTVNMSPTARNLTKKELGAVIFGCKHHTITECLLKQMFGLPASHYSYVKNVTPGLALFLFNYSDRKLHGVFEAASPGQMNINPYAWITSEGTESTPYAAQVRVNVRRQCRPLLEEDFKPIIAKNYYAKRLFWFELDKEQTSRLTKIFLSSPLPGKMPRAPNVAQWNNVFDVLSNSDINEKADEDFKNLDSQEFSGMAETKLTENDHLYAPVVVNKDAFAPEKKWAELFKTSQPSNVVESSERSESHEVILDSSVSDQFDMEWEFASSSHKMNNLHPEACQDAANTKYDSYVVDCWEQHALMDSDATKIYENKLSCLQYHEQDSNRPADLNDGMSCQSRTSLEGEDGELKPLDLESVVAKEPGEDLPDTKEVRSGNAFAPKEKCERDHTVPNLTNKVFHENDNAMSGRVLMDMQSSDFESVIIKLMREIEGLKDSQLKQMLKVDSVEHELSQSKLEIDHLKKRCHKLESVPFSASNHSNLQDCEPANFTTEESVLILGGFDGCSWLSDLSLYSLSENHFKSLCPMTFLRSYASVAKLNGELYIFGGVHDGVWHDTVESYNLMSNQWVKQPSLNQKKGSLAGASIYDKIFAIGGGNGVECFSDVELFDVNIGRWISTQSMFEK